MCCLHFPSACIFPGGRVSGRHRGGACHCASHCSGCKVRCLCAWSWCLLVHMLWHLLVSRFLLWLELGGCGGGGGGGWCLAWEVGVLVGLLILENKWVLYTAVPRSHLCIMCYLRLLGYLMDHVSSLVGEWYPGLTCVLCVISCCKFTSWTMSTHWWMSGT